MCSRSVSSTVSVNASVCRIDRSVSCAMFRPPTVTASVSGLSRAPPQAAARDLAHELLELVALAVGLGLRVPPLDARAARPRRSSSTTASGRTGCL